MGNPQPANPNLGKVVKFTNITEKDFTHPFGGQPFFVKAGETVMLPYDLAKHLAKHLSRRIYLDKDLSLSVYDPNDKTGGVGKAIWNDEQEQAMMARILGETIQEATPIAKSEMELLREQVAQLQERFGAGEFTKPVSPVEATVATPAQDGVVVPPVDDKVVTDPTLGYQDKSEVIAELKKRNIPFDARQSKAKLEALLV